MRRDSFLVWLCMATLFLAALPACLPVSNKTQVTTSGPVETSTVKVESNADVEVSAEVASPDVTAEEVDLTGLKAEIAVKDNVITARDNEIAGLKGTLGMRDVAIEELKGELTVVKVQLSNEVESGRDTVQNSTLALVAAIIFGITSGPLSIFGYVFLHRLPKFRNSIDRIKGK